MKHRYRLTAFDMSKQKELDAYPKVIQQVEFVGQLKNTDGVDVDGKQSMSALTILEIITGTRLKFSQGRVTVLKMWQTMKKHELN